MTVAIWETSASSAVVESFLLQVVNFICPHATVQPHLLFIPSARSKVELKRHTLRRDVPQLHLNLVQDQRK